MLQNQLSEYLTKIYPSYSFPISKGISSISHSIHLDIKSNPNSNELNNNNNIAGSFSISNKENRGFIIGTDEQGVLFGVYALLENLGYGFFISGDVIPKPKQVFDFEAWNIIENPTTEKRINFNWHNFISGCTGWDLEHWKKWIEQSAKLRFNTIMVHAYGNNPMETFSHNGIEKKNRLPYIHCKRS